MNPFKLFLLPILIISTITCREEDPIEIRNTQEFNNFIDEEMEIQKIPAMSVLIFNNEEIRYERCAGKSDLEEGLSLEEDHLFLLASISKTITAAALLQLYDRDSFQLDDEVNNYLPFQVKIPNQPTDITFRMLLTHTSGIADGSALDNQYYYGIDSPIGLGFFLKNYLEIGGQFYNASENFYDFQPGTQHEYSNTGNALMGLLVEEISGKNFNLFCKENIFIPLGMMNTYWRLDEINQIIVKPYDFDDNGNNKAIQHYTFTDYPNGGLRSNARDMFRFLSAISQEGVYSGVRNLKASTAKQMAMPQIPNLDDEVGLHLFIMNAQYGLWGHDGGEQGVTTIMAYNPTTMIGALIFTNQGDASLETILREAYKLGSSL
ncbi:MAG: beta-lactamase family protein [Flavobacteriales bacterium]|nr:beta-lactamase family protein [Flavobacteriales bacterium]